ncbi:ankyrin repeat domain-containing protein [Enterovibrio norvegicus]|uniref:ankyrin repeat domain-containing protein n=1 Tax=Enterovibrio norvegicus TaxID=188144 RepID=UPI00354BEF9E
MAHFSIETLWFRRFNQFGLVNARYSNVRLYMTCRKIQLTFFIMLSVTLQIYACEKNEFPYSDESRPLVKALDACDISEVRRLLAENESPTDYANTDFTPIHYAAARGAVEALALMLDISKDMELREKDVQGRTPLFTAVNLHRVDVVQYLLKRGANANATTLHGYTVLHMAAGEHEEALEIVELLVKAGANVNATTPYGTSVLMSALNVGYEDVVEFILAQGADTNKQDLEQDTALHYAAYQSNPKIIIALLRHGADPSMKNAKGLIPEDVAAENNHLEVEKLLEQSRKHKSPNKTLQPTQKPRG